MAKHRKYKVEKTKAGFQFIIPGTERVAPVVPSVKEYTTEGTQFVIPGAEQISTREFLRRKMAQPTMPRCRQHGLAGTALFEGR